MSATELTFAKTFLSLLDTKPTKIGPDHIEDPRNYPSTNPYTLPIPPSHPPLPKPTTTTSKTRNAPGTDPSLTLHIRSLRNPPLNITLPSLPISTTSALDIKALVSSQSTIATDKLKLLYNKKPVADSKTLKDIIIGGGGDSALPANGTVEFTVMVMGGAAALGTAAPSVGEQHKGAPVATGMSGEDVLRTDEFWGDLKGFLQQRIKDESVAGEVTGLFRGAWEKR